MKRHDHNDFLPGVLAAVAVTIMGVAVRINANGPAPASAPNLGAPQQAMPDAGSRAPDHYSDRGKNVP